MLLYEKAFHDVSHVGAAHALGAVAITIAAGAATHSDVMWLIFMCTMTFLLLLSGTARFATASQMLLAARKGGVNRGHVPAQWAAQATVER